MLEYGISAACCPMMVSFVENLLRVFCFVENGVGIKLVDALVKVGVEGLYLAVLILELKVIGEEVHRPGSNGRG